MAMKASFNIDINDYMSVNEIGEMIHDEVRYQISDKVDKALRHVAISDIIYSTARKIAMQILEEQDIDLHQKMADKVLECIDDLSLYYILRNIDDKTLSAGQIVLNECVWEARPKIRKKVDDIIEDKLNADWLVDCVVNDFYDRLRNQLIRK